MSFPTPFGPLDGVAPLLVFAMTQTECLAGAINRYESHNVPLPEHISSAMNALSHHLLLLRPADGLPIVPAHGLDKQQVIENNLEIAWYLAANILFHNRINNISNEGVAVAVDEVSMCLLRAESFKEDLQPEVILRNYPATFPAFVAACNAIYDREAWECWWTAMQRYNCPKIRAQWMVIQMIWKFTDELREAEEYDLSWVEILQGSGSKSLWTLFEELGFY
ncbi:uncharacterized protein N7479_011256 [Penicillium vulpinum]|uniref:Transcription factor domain-containing protein n=1 Tax=Penicillium vulpinum TaxID=29845 RepID=A0A1V6RX46_9EURO|nr:uncharacterized protein N7479_011256 [Penicillium vulpinum]KAJ5952843.1 hypothetical protein N7479_011256 [Penicillium vulpinum]OQE06337.1 hypothetical protein PENVUL_c018G09505 [Penicillium vulpinum]